jgi:hypothetical protein
LEVSTNMQLQSAVSNSKQRQRGREKEVKNSICYHGCGLEVVNVLIQGGDAVGGRCEAMRT